LLINYGRLSDQRGRLHNVRPLKLGLIGYGHRGQGMLNLALRGFPQIAPAAICEISEVLREQATRDHPHAPVFEDFDRMMDTVPLDALLVETPAALHARFCCGALERNVHVMSDVPAVDTVEQGNALYEASEKSRAIYMMGANPNMWGFVDALAEIKASGAIGEPYYAEAEYIHDTREYWEGTPWRGTYESIRYCTHSLGPLLRLIDEDLEWVSCFDAGSHINRQPGQHDAMVAIFRTRSNVVVKLLTTFVNYYPGCNHHYRIFGTRGYLERTPRYNGKARTLRRVNAPSPADGFEELPVDEMPPRYASNVQAGGHGGADYALLDRFFGAIRGGLPSPVSAREALRMTLPGIYAAESARRGGELTRIRYPWSSSQRGGAA
jgi:predicted dehydrogenase